MGEAGPAGRGAWHLIGTVQQVLAPAKLTISLRVEGRRPDGFHELRAEMVSLDLADVLLIDPNGDDLVVDAQPGSRAEGLSRGPDNLVRKALAAMGRHAAVRVLKRIPVGGGLGGGSTDAAAILRWSGCADLDVAASLGADVPFCLIGGRAMVTGRGEHVAPLVFEERSFVLLIPPFGVDTGAVYRAWDELGAAHGARGGPNDLVGPAIAVEPRLAAWRDRLAALTGRSPVLAGSGSTWFVEGGLDELGLAGATSLDLGGEVAALVAVRTVPPLETVSRGT